MFEELLNINIKTCSDAEQKAWFKQVIPIITVFLQIGQKLLQNTIQENAIPCHMCLKKETCNSPCELLESLLPAKDEGKGYKEKTIGICLEKFKDLNTSQPSKLDHKKTTSNHDSLKTKKIIRSTDTYENYQKCWDNLSAKQKNVITLHYKYGLSQKEIAEKNNKGSSSVSALLKRAQEEKEKYERKLRTEKFNLLKKLNTE